MSDNTLSNKKIAKNSVFLSIRLVIVLIVSLYTTRAVLKVLGVVDYGVYNVVCGFVSMFTFLNTSMSNGIQRFYNFELGRSEIDGANMVYCTSLVIQLLLAIVILILTESFGLWYLHNKMVIPLDRVIAAEWVFQFSILSFIFIIMQAPYIGAVMAHEKMNFFSLVSVIDAFLKLGIVFILPILTGDKLIIYGVLLSSISAISFFLYYVYCKKHFEEIHFRKLFDKSLFKSMLSFSGWNLFGSFSGVMQTQGIALVLNFYFGPILNAAKGIAAQIQGALQGFVNTISVPVRPQIVQSYAKGNLSRTMNLTISISKISCYFFLIMAIPISAEIDFVLHLWLGNSVPQHTAAFTVIVLISALTSNLNAATSNLIHATGEMKDYQLWGSLIKICSVPISFFIIKKYSIPEIALLVVTVCGIIAHITCLIAVNKVAGLSLKLYFKEVVLPLALVLAVSLCVVIPIRCLIEEGFLRFIIIVIANTISIILSLYYFAFNIKERSLFIQLFKSMIKL